MKLRFKVLLIIFTLVFVLIVSVCTRKDNNTIVLRVVWVLDNRFPIPTETQTKYWLDEVKYFYFKEANVNLEFKDMGHIKISNFFKDEFDSEKRPLNLEKYRFAFTEKDIDSLNSTSKCNT